MHRHGSNEGPSPPHSVHFCAEHIFVNCFGKLKTTFLCERVNSRRASPNMFPEGGSLEDRSKSKFSGLFCSYFKTRSIKVDYLVSHPVETESYKKKAEATLYDSGPDGLDRTRLLTNHVTSAPEPSFLPLPNGDNTSFTDILRIK